LDCSDLSIYLVFTEGQIYRYNPESIETGRALIAAANHGLTFNQLYRLFGVSGQMGAYERVTSIPGTAVLQYQNPPYPGTDPGPCAPSIFDSLLWTQSSDGPNPSVWTLNPPTGATGPAVSGSASGFSTTATSNLYNTGVLTFTGAAATYHASIDWTVNNAPTDRAGWEVSIMQGITFVYEFATTGTGHYVQTDPFNLADGIGLNTAITVVVNIGSATGPDMGESVSGIITLEG
jgi:hypothetical protein